MMGRNILYQPVIPGNHIRTKSGIAMKSLQFRLDFHHGTGFMKLTQKVFRQEADISMMIGRM
jgi:hypothetical protein